MRTPDPVEQELPWRGAAGHAMPSPAAAERLDVIKGIGNRFGSPPAARAMHPPILVAVEQALHRCVVPAISLAAHRADHPVFPQPPPEGVAGILARPVRIVNPSGRRLAARPRHRRRTGHDIGRHPRFQGPAEDLPVEPIGHHGRGASRSSPGGEACSGHGRCSASSAARHAPCRRKASTPDFPGHRRCPSIRAQLTAHLLRSAPWLFFRISHPILRRAFSARSRISSICSGASALPARRVQPPCAGLPSPGCAGPARPTPVPWQLTRWSGRTSLASPPVR